VARKRSTVKIGAPVLPAAGPELNEVPLEEVTPPEEMPPVEVPPQQT
jgi:hypothetical protein